MTRECFCKITKHHLYCKLEGLTPPCTLLNREHMMTSIPPTMLQMCASPPLPNDCNLGGLYRDQALTGSLQSPNIDKRWKCIHGVLNGRMYSYLFGSSQKVCLMLRPWSSWTANSDKKYMELIGAALNINKPCETSRKTAFLKDKSK